MLNGHILKLRIDYLRRHSMAAGNSEEPVVTSREAQQNIKNTLNIRLQRETNEAKKAALRELEKHL
jgi:hypothetical protein